MKAASFGLLVGPSFLWMWWAAFYGQAPRSLEFATGGLLFGVVVAAAQYRVVGFYGNGNTGQEIGWGLTSVGVFFINIFATPATLTPCYVGLYKEGLPWQARLVFCLPALNQIAVAGYLLWKTQSGESRCSAIPIKSPS